jgi:hypothetical protein
MRCHTLANTAAAQRRFPSARSAPPRAAHSAFCCAHGTLARFNRAGSHRPVSRTRWTPPFASTASCRWTSNRPCSTNDQYIGKKGQMGPMLTLEPGECVVRLLLADNKHLPYFVYSKPVKVMVTKGTNPVDPKETW